MRFNKHTIITFLAVIILGVPWLVTSYPQSRNFIDNIFAYADDNFASVILHSSPSVAQLHEKYDAVPKGKPKIRIIIVPGHEPGFGGTEYKDLKERDMNVDLAQDLKSFFENNSHYEIVLARDKNSWNPDLQNYFNNNWYDIISFFKERKDEMLKLINDGFITKATDGVVHNNVKQDVTLRLYGINKWVDENKVDIAIHVHFNDYPRNNTSIPGKYSGFAIYVPEKQYSNSTTTNAIANTVFKRLSKYNAVSNLQKEDVGIVQEQDLIAIGSYNTLVVPSMLIEYGYIYEPQFADVKVRESTIKDLAFQTYLGIQDFFGSGNDVSLAYDTLMLPYSWKNKISENYSNRNDVLALQTALMLDGDYPANGETKNACPRTGKFGPCTMDALKLFQNKYNIKDENNFVGEKTEGMLNSLYSVQLK